MITHGLRPTHLAPCKEKITMHHKSFDNSLVRQLCLVRSTTVKKYKIHSFAPLNVDVCHMPSNHAESALQLSPTVSTYSTGNEELNLEMITCRLLALQHTRTRSRRTIYHLRHQIDAPSLTQAIKWQPQYHQLHRDEPAPWSLIYQSLQAPIKVKRYNVVEYHANILTQTWC